MGQINVIIDIYNQFLNRPQVIQETIAINNEVQQPGGADETKVFVPLRVEVQELAQRIGRTGFRNARTSFEATKVEIETRIQSLSA